MMYKILHWLFGWDYIRWENSIDQGIARVRVDAAGSVYYWRYWSIKVADPINRAEDFLWLTCTPDKYLGTRILTGTGIAEMTPEQRRIAIKQINQRVEGMVRDMEAGDE